MASRIILEEFSLATAPDYGDLLAGEHILFVQNNQWKKVDYQGNVQTYSTGITPEEVQDIIGASFENTSTISYTYNDTLNKISYQVIPSGISHTAITNIGTNTHAQIDTFISVINETIDDRVSTLVSATTPIIETYDDVANTLTLSHATSGVVAGTYGSASSVGVTTVNAQGHVTQVSTSNIAIPSTQVTDFNEAVDDRVSTLITATSPIVETYNDTSNTFTLSHADSGVVAGTYGSATEINTTTVNAQGHVTQVGTVAIAIPSTQVTDIIEKIQDTVSSMWISGTGIQTSYNDTAGFLTVSVNQANLDHTLILNKGTNTHAQIDTHLANTSNPHSTTASQVGADPSGTATGIMAGHVGSPDPHAQYLKETDATALYAPMSHVHIAYDDYIANAEERRVDVGEPTGFIDITDSTIAFANGTRTFSISPTGSSYSYYQKGNKFTLGTVSKQITNVEGMHFIYFDGNTLYETQTFTNAFYNDYVYVACLYWSVASQTQIFMGDHRHGCVMSWATHKYINDNHGILIKSGGALTDIIADATGALNTHIQFGVSPTYLANADIEYNLTARTSTTAISKYYRIGVDADKKWTEVNGDSYPVITGVNGRAVCNKLVSGSWTLTQLVTGHYVLAHVLTYSDTSRKYCVLLGQNDYATLEDARNNILNEVSSLAVDGIPVREFKFLGTLIIQTSDSYTNSLKSRIISTASGEPYTDLRYSNFVTSAGTPVGDHANLTNIQGGNYGEYYHLTQAQHTNVNAHITNTSNPHSVTKTQVGLSNVPNTDATLRSNHTGTQAATTITGLATVATTGSYSDLTNTPTVYDVEGIQDIAAAMFLGTTPITATYSDAGNSLTIAHTNSGVVAGTYGSASSVGITTVNALGHITGVSTANIAITSAQITDLSEAIDDRMVAAVIATAPITETYNDTANTLTLSLANSGVTAGTYGSATQSNSVTVDALGRVTAASATNIAIPSTQITDITEKIQDTVATMLVPQFPMLTFYDDVGDGSLQIGLNTSSIDHSEFSGIGVNTHDQIDTFISSIAETIDDRVTALITATTPIVETYNDTSNTLTLSLANSGVTAGTYGSAANSNTFTVDALGRITAASQTAIAITKAQAGLNLVDNTSDLSKPISTATQTALNGKQATIANGTLGQYFTYDKTWKKVSLYELNEYSVLSTPIDGDVLYYDGTSWRPQTLPTTPLYALPDVGVSQPIPDKHVLRYDAAGFVWTNAQLDSTYISNFSEAVDDRVASLISVGPGLAISYADSSNFMSISFGSTVGYYNKIKSITTYSNTSNTATVAITDLNISVYSGVTIRGTYHLRVRTAATTTGLSIAFNTLSGTIAATVTIALTATTSYVGNLNSPNVYITATGHPAASSTYLAQIDFTFTASANTTLGLIFKSEVSASGVFIDPNSSVIYMEI